MRKRRKQAFAVFLAAAALLGLAVMGHAEEQTVPRAVFTNAKSTTPDLYVKKEVEDADSRYPSDPEAEFSFILKLDGELANKLEYQVFGSDGQEVFKTESGVTVPFKTDAYGKFTLKAGQTAKFTYVGDGVQYQVSESSMPEGFSKISPVGDAVGTTDEDGAFVTFTNRYTESVDPPDPDEGTVYTSFTAEKRVSFPYGYEYVCGDEFGFTLTIDGQPWALENYTFYDADTGEKLGSGQTDENGHFTLGAGEKAKFSVPVDVDYRIVEDEASGWTDLTGMLAGATKYPITETVFTNLQASFGVKKTANEETDETFTFALYDGDGKEMPGEKYLLYTSKGTLVDEEEHETDEKGRFTLLSGQTAIFLGMPVTTDYRVQELQSSGWIQAVPSSADGYEREVSTSVEVLPFVNYKQDVIDGTLSVSKAVENSKGYALTEDTAFTFILYEDDETGYVPMGNAKYTITSGKSVSSYVTGEDGSFTLKANQTAVFTGLADGNYKVEEILDDDRFTSDNSVQEVALEGTAEVAVTNHYVPYGSLSIYKGDADDETVQVPGAVYAVYSDEACTQEVKRLTTGEDGYATAKDILLGTYYIKEVSAPNGYRLNGEVYVAELTSPSETATLSVTDEKQIGYISIAKVSSWDNTALAGAAFGIYTDEACGEDSLIETITTADDGTATSQALPLGIYYVKEAQAPEGFLLSETVYTVSLAEDHQTVAVNDGGAVANDPLSAQIEVLKVNAINNAIALKGAVFSIYTDQDCTEEFLVDTMETGEDGKAVSDELLLGTYYVKETTAPEGYALNSTVYTAELTEHGTTVSIGTVTDKPVNGSITVVKYESDGKTALAGVSFRLDKPDGTSETLTTGSNGTIKFEGLETGTYTLTETKTAAGHSLLADSITAEIPLVLTEEEAEAWDADITKGIHDETAGTYLFYDITYHVTNSVTLSLPTTGDGKFAAVWAGLAAALAGILFLAYRRKKTRTLQ